MTGFTQVPVDRLAPDTLTSLLEEFASRDGTDYGEHETPLDERVAQLRRRLAADELRLYFHTATESWDLVSTEGVEELMRAESAADGTGNDHEF